MQQHFLCPRQLPLQQEDTEQFNTQTQEYGEPRYYYYRDIPEGYHKHEEQDYMHNQEGYYKREWKLWTG